MAKLFLSSNAGFNAAGHLQYDVARGEIIFCPELIVETAKHGCIAILRLHPVSSAAVARKHTVNLISTQL